jgi:hypothetical protein
VDLANDALHAGRYRARSGLLATYQSFCHATMSNASGPRPAEHVAAARAELRAVVRAELLAEGLVVEARPKLPPAEEEARGPPAASEATHEAAEGAGVLPRSKRGVTLGEAARAACERH